LVICTAVASYAWVCREEKSGKAMVATMTSMQMAAKSSISENAFVDETRFMAG